MGAAFTLGVLGHLCADVDVSLWRRCALDNGGMMARGDPSPLSKDAT